MRPDDLPLSDEDWEQTPAAVQALVSQLWCQVKEREVEITRLHAMIGDEGPARGKKRVLIVDDSPLVRKTVAMIVKKHGHQVFEATDGDLLVKEAKKNKPDLIIIDVNMARKSGVEALKDLRAESELKEIPVVMLTSETNRNTVREALAHQIKGYLIKDTQDIMEERLLEFLNE